MSYIPCSPYCYDTLQNWAFVIVLPSKSDSGVMFCLQSYHGLIIDRSLVYQSYPQDRINTQMICRLALAQVECTNLISLNNCKQNITSLVLFVGTTVPSFPEMETQLSLTNTFKNKQTRIA